MDVVGYKPGILERDVNAHAPVLIRSAGPDLDRTAHFPLRWNKDRQRIGSGVYPAEPESPARVRKCRRGEWRNCAVQDDGSRCWWRDPAFDVIRRSSKQRERRPSHEVIMNRGVVSGLRQS